MWSLVKYQMIDIYIFRSDVTGCHFVDTFDATIKC